MFKKEKWGLIIAGIVMAILGIIALVHPAHSLEAIIIIVGVFSIINAIIAGYIAFTTRFKELRSREILDMFLNAIIGLIFLFSPDTAAGTIALMFAFWIIFLSVSNLSLAFSGFGISGLSRILLVLVGIFGIFAGVSMLLNWGISAASFIWFVGIFLISEGIATILSGFMLPSDEF
ncbi:HdeD family acid-resistance protein [Floricoccus penangensis]|uniref:HdeD family acid-resistance protein n=1 Tax=Floricoccus penangensis TaxID=1859475 RepID=UPI00203D79B4|nr:DUF308 domain-containing protein [Floricoccus penangensis]URZ86922.1 DUF308 domain-containing protein [Floricoccus penangensis]